VKREQNLFEIHGRYCEAEKDSHRHVPRLPKALNASAAILVSASSAVATLCDLLPLSWLITLAAGLAPSEVLIANSDLTGVWKTCWEGGLCHCEVC